MLPHRPPPVRWDATSMKIFTSARRPQSDELCACNWRKGDPTLDAGELGLRLTGIWLAEGIEKPGRAPQYAKTSS